MTAFTADAATRIVDTLTKARIYAGLVQMSERSDYTTKPGLLMLKRAQSERRRAELAKHYIVGVVRNSGVVDAWSVNLGRLATCPLANLLPAIDQIIGDCERLGLVERARFEADWQQKQGAQLIGRFQRKQLVLGAA